MDIVGVVESRSIQETPRFCLKSNRTARSPPVVESWELGTPAALPSREISRLPAPTGQTRPDEIRAVCTALRQEFRARPPFPTSTCSRLPRCVPAALASAPSPFPFPLGMFHAAPAPTLCWGDGAGHAASQKTDGMRENTPRQKVGKMSWRESGFWGWGGGMSPTNADPADWEW